MSRPATVIGLVASALASDRRTSLQDLETLYGLFLLLDTPAPERLATLEFLLAPSSAPPPDLSRLRLAVPQRLLLLKALGELRTPDGRPHPAAERLRRDLERSWKTTTAVLRAIEQLNNFEDRVIRLFNKDLPRETWLERAERLVADTTGVLASLAILTVAGKPGLSTGGVLSGLASVGKSLGLPFLSPVVAGFIGLAATTLATSRIVRQGLIPWAKRRLPGLVKDAPATRDLLVRHWNDLADLADADRRALLKRLWSPPFRPLRRLGLSLALVRLARSLRLRSSRTKDLADTRRK